MRIHGDFLKFLRFLAETFIEAPEPWMKAASAALISSLSSGDLH